MGHRQVELAIAIEVIRGKAPEVLASRQTTCRLEGPVSVGEVQRDHGAGITVIIEHPQVEPPIAVEVDHLDGAGKGTRMAGTENPGRLKRPVAVAE